MPQRFWAPTFLGVTSELPMPARLTHSYTGEAVKIAAISPQNGCSGIPSPLFWNGNPGPLRTRLLPQQGIDLLIGDGTGIVTGLKC